MAETQQETVEAEMSASMSELISLLGPALLKDQAFVTGLANCDPFVTALCGNKKFMTAIGGKAAAVTGPTLAFGLSR